MRDRDLNNRSLFTTLVIAATVALFTSCRSLDRLLGGGNIRKRYSTPNLPQDMPQQPLVKLVEVPWVLQLPRIDPSFKPTLFQKLLDALPSYAGTKTPVKANSWGRRKNRRQLLVADLQSVRSNTCKSRWLGWGSNVESLLTSPVLFGCLVAWHQLCTNQGH